MRSAQATLFQPCIAWTMFVGLAATSGEASAKAQESRDATESGEGSPFHSTLPSDSFLYLRAEPATLARGLAGCAFGRWLLDEDMRGWRAMFLRSLSGNAIPEEPVREFFAGGPIELGIRGLAGELEGRRFSLKVGASPDPTMLDALLSWLSRAQASIAKPGAAPSAPLILEMDAVCRLPVVLAVGGLLDVIAASVPCTTEPFQLGAHQGTRYDFRTELPNLVLRIHELVVDDAIWWSGCRDTLQECIEGRGFSADLHPAALLTRQPGETPWIVSWLDVEPLRSILGPLLPPALLEELEAWGLADQFRLSLSGSFANGKFFERFSVDWQGEARGLLSALADPSTTWEGPRLRFLGEVPSTLTIFAGLQFDPSALLRDLARTINLSMADGGVLQSRVLGDLMERSVETWIALDAFGGEIALLGKNALIPDAALVARVGDRSMLEAVLTNVPESFPLRTTTPSALPDGSSGLRCEDSELPFSVDVVWDQRHLYAGQSLTLRRWQRTIERVQPETSLAKQPAIQDFFQRQHLGSGEQVPLFVYVDMATACRFALASVPLLSSFMAAPIEEIPLAALLGGEPLPPWMLAIEQLPTRLQLVMEEPFPGMPLLGLALFTIFYTRLDVGQQLEAVEGQFLLLEERDLRALDDDGR